MCVKAHNCGSNFGAEMVGGREVRSYNSIVHFSTTKAFHATLIPSDRTSGSQGDANETLSSPQLPTRCLISSHLVNKHLISIQGPSTPIPHVPPLLHVSPLPGSQEMNDQLPSNSSWRQEDCLHPNNTLSVKSGVKSERSRAFRAECWLPQLRPLFNVGNRLTV